MEPQHHQKRTVAYFRNELRHQNTFDNKTPGPDSVNMEAFKELDDLNKDRLLELLQDWWIQENLPEEMLIARIVLILTLCS